MHFSTGSNFYIGLPLINKGTLNFQTTGKLYIDKDITNTTGTLTMNDAILHIGSGNPAYSGTHIAKFNPNDEIKFVELNKTSSGILNVNDGLLSITKTFTSKSGTLNANDRVVLKSTSRANTAIVPESTGGTINSIRVERYLDAGRKWRLLASPVNTEFDNLSSKTSIFNNWQQDGLNPGDVGYKSNVGTQITGGPIDKGFDQNQSGYPSLYTYNLSSGQYVPVTDNTNVRPLEIDEAYFMLVRGDRSVNLQINDYGTTMPTVINSTGSLHIGDYDPIPASSDAGGYTAFGNPYQSPVDMDFVIGNSPNLNNNYIVWDSEISALGGYVTVDLSTNTNNVPGSDADKFLQPGQSALVQTTNAAATQINFRETDKGNFTDLNYVYRSSKNPSSDSYLRLGLYDKDDKVFKDVAYDGFILKMGDYSNNYDRFDSGKSYRQEENLAVNSTHGFLAINARAFPSDLNEVIDLQTLNLTKSSYKFSVDLKGFISLPEGILLWDKYMDSFTSLSNHQVIPFEVDTSIPASKASDRFALVFKNKSLGIEDNSLANMEIFPNPIISNVLNIQFPSNTPNQETKISIYNVLGQKVYSKTINNISKTIKLENLNFSTGTYLLKIKKDKAEKSFKIIKD